jgi:hypothetical protein
MAYSLNDMRARILTSIHGRRLGLDQDEFLAGSKGCRKALTDATSDTTGTELQNNGFHSVVTTTDDTWTLEDPLPGVSVTLFTGSTSTGTHTIDVSPAVIYSTNGDEGDQVVFNSIGSYATLTGLTTAVWAVTSISSTFTGAAISS